MTNPENFEQKLTENKDNQSLITQLREENERLKSGKEYFEEEAEKQEQLKQYAQELLNDFGRNTQELLKKLKSSFPSTSPVISEFENTTLASLELDDD